MYSNMPVRWNALPPERVNSHSNGIDIQADVVDRGMPNLSCGVEGGGPKAHAIFARPWHPPFYH